MFEQSQDPYWDWCIHGHFSFVESEIHRKLGQFKRYAVRNYSGRLKIGATDDPDERWYYHRITRRWREMVVLWQTSSLRGIKLAENTIIQFAWDYDDIECLNEIASGYAYESDYYYLYVLLG